MLKKSTLLLLFSLLAMGRPGHAQTPAATMTEHPDKSDYKLSRAGFEDAYAFNDTARAIIRMYYAKWNSGRKIMRFAAIPVPVVTLVGRHYEPNPATYGASPNYNAYYYDSWVAPTAFSLLGVSAFGVIRAVSNGRDQLYQVIRQYRATRRLPPSVRPAALVPFLMQVQQEGVQPR
ncbi:hypothetical protein Q5H92_09630 [Hymenobacter sp. M29]|uniref:DUF4136 domain-containing protein n=1 Tax=Hymenobacter mellowenesis TaxID=3063995 RepID=A0ABT9A9V2_9BACT|nr:hypothetical protein [Hymenobacter sp. M29]MDO7846616.1 hypothetical protein [Hymenobacter sp. M29]